AGRARHGAHARRVRAAALPRAGDAVRGLRGGGGGGARVVLADRQQGDRARGVPAGHLAGARARDRTGAARPRGAPVTVLQVAALAAVAVAGTATVLIRDP